LKWRYGYEGTPQTFGLFLLDISEPQHPQKQDGQLNKTTIRWDDWMLAELESYKIFKGHKKGAITWNIMWVSDSCCGGTSPPLHGVLKGILSLPLIRR